MDLGSIESKMCKYSRKKGLLPQGSSSCATLCSEALCLLVEWWIWAALAFFFVGSNSVCISIVSKLLKFPLVYRQFRKLFHRNRE